MGLNFGTLVNAALGGSAAYMGGKREARVRAQKAADDQEEKLSRLTENRAQTDYARSQQRLAEWKISHPEEKEYEAKPRRVRELIEQGMSPEDARIRVRQEYGEALDPVHNAPRDPVADHRATRDYDIKHPLPSRAGGRDTGEAGSAKAATDRREFMQKRITHYTDAGYTGAEAQTAAEREYLGANYSANKTASALARSIPGSSSSNAGTRGVKPTETSSTQKHDPTNANSPKLGTMRQATDADIDRAIAAVGEDEAKIEKWLHDRRLEP